MATAISQLALADLFQREQPPMPNGRKIIVACVRDGELHDFPARMVADELDVAGFDVRFLGASVPIDSLVSFIARENPDLLVLSATMPFHADNVRTAVAQVRRLARGCRSPLAVRYATAWSRLPGNSRSSCPVAMCRRWCAKPEACCTRRVAYAWRRRRYSGCGHSRSSPDSSAPRSAACALSRAIVSLGRSRTAAEYGSTGLTRCRSNPASNALRR